MLLSEFVALSLIAIAIYAGISRATTGEYHWHFAKTNFARNIYILAVLAATNYAPAELVAVIIRIPWILWVIGLVVLYSAAYYAACRTDNIFLIVFVYTVVFTLTIIVVRIVLIATNSVIQRDRAIAMFMTLRLCESYEHYNHRRWISGIERLCHFIDTVLNIIVLM
jgi:hypothetical protein